MHLLCNKLQPHPPLTWLSNFIFPCLGELERISDTKNILSHNFCLKLRDIVLSILSFQCKSWLEKNRNMCIWSIWLPSVTKQDWIILLVNTTVTMANIAKNELWDIQLFCMLCKDIIRSLTSLILKIKKMKTQNQIHRYAWIVMLMLVLFGRLRERDQFLGIPVVVLMVPVPWNALLSSVEDTMNSWRPGRAV